jgi:hypothetical protein
MRIDLRGLAEGILVFVVSALAFSLALGLALSLPLAGEEGR